LQRHRRSAKETKDRKYHGEKGGIEVLRITTEGIQGVVKKHKATPGSEDGGRGRRENQ
jgi:hypothetical protein